MATNGKAPQTTRQVGTISAPVLNISGNAYAPVHVRVEAAHASIDGPGTGYTMVRCEWKLIFEIKCCEVEIAIGSHHFIGTAEVKPGFAYSIEDMQTSALGRALGFAGFEIKTAIASADDMEAVLRGQGRATVVESQPEALPEPGLRERVGELGHQLHMTEPEFRTFLYNHTADGKVDLVAAVSELEQRLEQHEQHMVALHAALAANPAD